MNLEAKHLGLWMAVDESITKINELTHEYIRKADDIEDTKPLDSINIRAQAIGLLNANQIVGEVLRDRDLLP